MNEGFLILDHLPQLHDLLIIRKSADTVQTQLNKMQRRAFQSCWEQISLWFGFAQTALTYTPQRDA